MLAAPPRHIMKIRRRTRVRALAGVAAGLCLGVGGCADLARVTSLGPEPISTSPAAGEVREAARRDFPTPSFRDVPPPPANVRPPEAFRMAVTRSIGAREQLQAWVAANPPLTDVATETTEAFAESQRARIPAGQREPIPAPAGTEDFAARLRELATPPPPPR